MENQQQPTVSNPPSIPQPSTIQQPSSVQPAGAWGRFWAGAIDSLIVGLIALPLLACYSLLGKSSLFNDVFLRESSNAQNTIGDTIITLIMLLIFIGYYIYFTYKKGATIGKDAYGFKVVSFSTQQPITLKQAVIRELFRVLYFFPFIGSLIYFATGIVLVFNKNKRSFPDFLAGSQVIKVGKPWPIGKQLVIFGVIFVLLAFEFWISSTLIAPFGTHFEQKKTYIIPSIAAPSPNKNPNSLPAFAEANNLLRSSNVNQILDAVLQFKKTNGRLPAGINITEKSISSTVADLCSDLIPNYSAFLPSDPESNEQGSGIKNCSSYDTGYTIVLNTDGSITVKAPKAQLGKRIEATK